MNKVFFVIVVILISSKSYSCSMFLDDYLIWGEKQKAFELIAIANAKKESDSIVVVRAIGQEDIVPVEKKERIEKEFIFKGPNPDAGNVISLHTVKVLEVLKGTHKKDDILKVKVIEPEYFNRGERCSKVQTQEDISTPESFDNTFKYLLYLNGDIVLRVNEFIEWHERVTAEEEYATFKK